jgi:hypothetical protein
MVLRTLELPLSRKRAGLWRGAPRSGLRTLDVSRRGGVFEVRDGLIVRNQVFPSPEEAAAAE